MEESLFFKVGLMKPQWMSQFPFLFSPLLLVELKVIKLLYNHSYKNTFQLYSSTLYYRAELTKFFISNEKQKKNMLSVKVNAKWIHKENH